jgi:macrolide-specific efflux system membrane fusion protein
MQVKVGFSESDATALKVGQAATVTISSLNDAQLAAHVIAVDTVGTTVSNVVTYYVTFALDRANRKAKPGMTATVDVVTAQKDNVLVVPTNAITTRGGSSTVQVVGDGGKLTSTTIVTGLAGDAGTQVISGLKLGQKVQITTATANLPTSSSSSSSSLTSSRSGLGGATGGFGGGGGGAGGFAGGGGRPGG